MSGKKGMKQPTRSKPLQLKDMEAVYRQTPDKDTPQQKKWRQMYEEDFKGFTDRVMRLQLAWKGVGEPAEGPAEAGPVEVADGDSERVEELIEQLLAEVEAEMRGGDKWVTSEFAR